MTQFSQAAYILCEGYSQLRLLPKLLSGQVHTIKQRLSDHGQLCASPLEYRCLLQEVRCCLQENKLYSGPLCPSCELNCEYRF